MSKPDGYPLPWCEKADLPYWKINLWMCFIFPEWREYQARLPMSEIIPIIDNILEKSPSSTQEAAR